MEFSTQAFDTEAAGLRAFHGADLGSLPRGDLLELQHRVGAARRSLDALVASLAGELGRRSAPELGAAGLSRREGFSSPQSMLARALGSSMSEAGRMVDVGRTLVADAAVVADAPAPPTGDSGNVTHRRHLAGAVRAGAISVESAALISRTLDSLDGDLDGLELRLVEAAQRLAHHELRQVCQRARATHDRRSLMERERINRDARSLVFSEDADGMTTMTARLDATSAAPVKAWIDAQVRHAFQQRRDGAADAGQSAGDLGAEATGAGPAGSEPPAEGDHAAAAGMSDSSAATVRTFDTRSAAQIRVDALVMLAQHGMGCDAPASGVKTTVVIRVDASELASELGLGESDDLRMPISASTLRAMAVDAEILPIVMGGDSLPLDLGRARRLFTKAQRLALVERDGGCSWCHAPPSFCEAHHIRWWDRHRGRTDLSNGVLLCTSCHHRVHRDGWDIRVDDGEVWFTPPASIDRERRPRIGGKARLTLAA